MPMGRPLYVHFIISCYLGTVRGRELLRGCAALLDATADKSAWRSHAKRRYATTRQSGDSRIAVADPLALASASPWPAHHSEPATRNADSHVVDRLLGTPFVQRSFFFLMVRRPP